MGARKESTGWPLDAGVEVESRRWQATRALSKGGEAARGGLPSLCLDAALERLMVHFLRRRGTIRLAVVGVRTLVVLRGAGGIAGSKERLRIADSLPRGLHLRDGVGDD